MSRRALVNLLRKTSLAPYLVDLYGWVTDPRGQLELWGDLRETRVDAAFLRDLPPAPADAPVALLLSLANVPFAVKCEGLLTAALRLKGWRVMVLTSSLYTWDKRYFRAFGIDEFVDFEDILPMMEEGLEVRAAVARMIGGPLTFDIVRNWTYRDAWIGPPLLSHVSRQMFNAAPDPARPDVQRAIADSLPRILAFVHRAEALVGQIDPTLIIANEPNYAANGAVVDVAIARGRSVIHYTQPSRDDAMVFKRLTRETRRIHPSSVAPDTFETLASQPWTGTHERLLNEQFAKRYSGAWFLQARNQTGTRERSRDEIVENLGLDPKKPIATVFSHVLWDANLFYGEDLFENYGHWFVETVRAAAANPNVNWLIKLHPANIWKREAGGVTGEYAEVTLIREHLGELPDNVKLLMPSTDISSLSLFRASDYGITVRGTIGIELPCFGVPVITAGTGRYSGFGFTIDHDSADAYLATLARLQDVPRLTKAQVLRAKHYAYTLFVRRPWVFSSFVCKFNIPGKRVLTQDVKLVAKTSDALSRVGDLDRWARWAGDLTAVDYLADDPAALPVQERDDMEEVGK